MSIHTSQAAGLADRIIEAIDARDGVPARIAIAGGRIVAREALGAGEVPRDLLVAPAFWDVQNNGRLGRSFADPTLSREAIREVLYAQPGLGVARVCPTLITAPMSDMMAALRNLAEAIREDPLLDRMIPGVHLEGPMISPLDGYRGAHPIGAVRDLAPDDVDALSEAVDGRISILTLAPERPGAIGVIERAVARGIVVALGHTAADGKAIRAAVDAGARLSTHLGNGIRAELPRHPNPIWEQAGEDRLFASLIADDHHLAPCVLRTLARAKTPERCLLVSDASPLAGLPPGVYGDWAVSPDGRVVVAGTEYLAGSNRDLVFALNHWRAVTGARVSEAIPVVADNPARLLGHPVPRLETGESADLVLFREVPGDPPRLELVETLVGGRAFAPDAGVGR